MSFFSAPSANSSLAWVLGNRGEGRFTITFPCNLNWYNEQPCTRFQTLQHRKERTGFWHEYIVLKLMDGSICRLERMGHPYARIEALSAQGTTAHDIARCFRPKQIPEADLGGSDIIAEVTFPQPLDLIDVLRVCRAIQEGEKTCNYTLLSSNCYFFCLAIQACLTRLVADWRIQSPSDDLVSVWKDSLNTLGDTLSLAGRQKAPLLRVYSMFSLSTSLVDRIVEELLPRLNASLIQLYIDQALVAELWHSNLESRANLALENMTKRAVIRALQPRKQHFKGVHLPPVPQIQILTRKLAIHIFKDAVIRLVLLAVKKHTQLTGKVLVRGHGHTWTASQRRHSRWTIWTFSRLMHLYSGRAIL